MSLSDVSATSDKDYLKIWNDNLESISTSAASDADFAFPADAFGGGAQQGIVTVNHLLGVVPMVRAFIDPGKNGLWYSSQAVIGSTPIDPILLTLITTSQFKMCVQSGTSKTNIPVFWRLYQLGVNALDSDNRIDKIFSKSTPGYFIDLGAAASSASPVQSNTPIAHGQTDAPIWTMQFSDDGAHWYNDGNYIYGAPDTTSGPPGGPYARYFYMRAYAAGDATNFYVRVEHNYPGTKRFYVRWVLDYRT